jgi:hypothetical protein
MILAYCLSLMAFLIGCWLIVYLAGASYQASESDTAHSSSEVLPYAQSGKAKSFTYTAKEHAVRFLAER